MGVANSGHIQCACLKCFGMGTRPVVKAYLFHLRGILQVAVLAFLGSYSPHIVITMGLSARSP